jgi:hypothetical protein
MTFFIMLAKKLKKMKKPKKVYITSLSMRFPLSEGWTNDILSSYTKGSFALKGFGPGEWDAQYFIPYPGSKLDIDAMVRDKVISEDSIIGKEAWSELGGLSNIEALKERNW